MILSPRAGDTSHITSRLRPSVSSWMTTTSSAWSGIYSAILFPLLIGWLLYRLLKILRSIFVDRNVFVCKNMKLKFLSISTCSKSEAKEVHEINSHSVLFSGELWYMMRATRCTGIDPFPFLSVGPISLPSLYGNETRYPPIRWWTKHRTTVQSRPPTFS